MRPLLTFLLLTSCLWAQESPPVGPPEEETPVFGVSVYQSGGLTGNVYKLDEGKRSLPNFKKMKPIATLYTQSLNVTSREFTKGFPGVPDVFEWFAIDYTGRFWVEKPGQFVFYLTSDDGSRLSIDGKKVIDNNGLHVPETKLGVVKLERGVHDLHVEYFQGPKFHVALILEVQAPGGEKRVFNTQDFRPSEESIESGLVTSPAARKK